MSADPAELRQAVQASEALQGELAGIEEQLGMIGSLSQELQRSRDALEALRGAEAGDEVLLPIGGGNFVRATLAEPRNVISGVGAGVSVEAPLADAVRRVDDHLEQAKQAGQRLQEEGARIVEQLRAVEARLGELAG